MSDLFAGLINDTETSRILKPPFGYPGGKGKSIGKLATLIPYRNGYIEPFGGSGAVLLGRHKSNLEVFNDRYAGVTDFYRVVKNKHQLDRLLEWLEMTVHSREEWHFCKDTWTNPDDPVERAGRWLYMTSYSFAGLGRNFGRSTTGKNGISGKVRAKIPKFHEIHERFKDVCIENLDWYDLCTQYDHKDTIIYMDPPYIDVARGTYKNEMTIQDHSNMLAWIRQCRSTVCVSGYPNDLYDAQDWDARHCWDVEVSMTPQNCPGNNNPQKERGIAQEVLWIKYG